MNPQAHEDDVLAERFEAHRPWLRAVAYQTLGSATEADDAVQETWLRLSRSDPGHIENLGGWLTTVVARVCPNMLASRRDQPVGMHLPETVVSDAAGVDPETEAKIVAVDLIDQPGRIAEADLAILSR
jgi:DNA-directed RNA polymerase specialized sigma24 family protein